MLYQTSPITTSSENKKDELQEYFSGSTVSPLIRRIEARIFQGAIEQANSAISSSWCPRSSESFTPKTELGKKLWMIKKKLAASGHTTNDWKQVIQEINEARDIKK